MSGRSQLVLPPTIAPNFSGSEFEGENRSVGRVDQAYTFAQVVDAMSAPIKG